MSEPNALRRRDLHRTYAWFGFGLIALAMVLALLMLSRRVSHGAVGPSGPTMRPQSDTRPLPPPSVARTRDLAA